MKRDFAKTKLVFISTMSIVDSNAECRDVKRSERFVRFMHFIWFVRAVKIILMMI